MNLLAKWLCNWGPRGSRLLQKLCGLLGRPLIEVKYNCGYGNRLYIRGQLPSLSWSLGQAMTNLEPDRWIWIAPVPCSGPFKILLNDKIYEEGPNHLLVGQRILVEPLFGSATYEEAPCEEAP